MNLPQSSEAILVAVSGGADSTALLLAIHELIDRGKLSLRVSVVHLDHGLRAASRKDAKWVSQLARELGFEAIIGHTKVRELAREEGDNLEQAARRARYEFFLRTAKKKGARFVLTAHTMDDQAETVLLRLMRGSASIGLSGMESLRPLEKGSKIQLARPLLWARRSDTEGYCKAQKREFLVDEMNSDDRFARVKVRKQLLPLMQSFNNRIVDALSRTATLLREDSAVLFSSASDLLRLASEYAIANETRPEDLGQHWADWLREWARHMRSSMGEYELMEHYICGMFNIERMIEMAARKMGLPKQPKVVVSRIETAPPAKAAIKAAMALLLEEHQNWHLLVRPHDLPLA